MEGLPVASLITYHCQPGFVSCLALDLLVLNVGRANAHQICTDIVSLAKSMPIHIKHTMHAWRMVCPPRMCTSAAAAAHRPAPSFTPPTHLTVSPHAYPETFWKQAHSGPKVSAMARSASYVFVPCEVHVFGHRIISSLSHITQSRKVQTTGAN